jgi:hypothetical protein
MVRLCYVHREAVHCGRSVGSMPGSWRSVRPHDQLGTAHDPISRHPDFDSPIGMARTITRYRRDEQSSQQTLG